MNALETENSHHLEEGLQTPTASTTLTEESSLEDNHHGVTMVLE